jgi:dienelactone hydrolase
MPFQPLAVLLGAALTAAQAPTGVTFDHTAPPGANYDKAELRLWVPTDAAAVRAVLVLTPGSNGDGRGDVDDVEWQAFAVRQRMALVGVHFTDKQPSIFEEYADVSKGSGQAILDGLEALASKSRHPEIANAPLLLWGMSAGGEVNYELTAWKPERVIAFVVNKGGIYYTALVPKAARNVPAVLFIGGKDSESRTDVVTGLFALNRRGGGLWALAEEPGAAHVVGKSKALAMVFFEDILPMRLAADGTLKAVAEQDGFTGDVHVKTFKKAEPFRAGVMNAWLPTERFAKAWQAMETERPLDTLAVTPK